MATATKKPRPSKLEQVHINIGLEVLHPVADENSKSSAKVAVDIVAIPGLGANPEWTWVKEKVHWLRDSNMLARKVQNPRISVFQYQSQWFGKGSVDQKLENVADQLLYQLERFRGDDAKTPIIFVCHCLGGIVLEKALLTARLRQNDFPSIFPWVAGCVFLGTPFYGTPSQDKALVLAKMAETIGLGVPSHLLKLLEKDSETLTRMLHEFVRLSNDAQIRNFCFFESEKSDLIGVLKKGLPIKSLEVIVDEDSATYPGVEKLHLASDHFALNKYAGPKDGNFVSVSNEIKVTAQRAAGIIKSRQNARRQALINDRTYHSIIDALGKGFTDLDAAVRGNYKGPKAADASKPNEQGKTGEVSKSGDSTKPEKSWIFDVDQYKTWKEQQSDSLLWIHGKPGTGQGAIASSVIERFGHLDDPASLTASFFCDQNDENRRTLQGLLKIVIRQVINANQDMAVHLLTDSKKGKAGASQEFDPETFSKTSVLWNALQAMARGLASGSIYIVIYGLDQLSSEALAELFLLIKDARTSGADTNDELAPIKWMLLSRSGRPDIEKFLKAKALEINLDDSENAVHVSDALRSDVSLRVDALGLPTSVGYFVKRHIHSRAEGNYVYVSLAIQEVKNAQESGKSAFAEIRALLESFPYGLTDMFEHVRKRVLNPGSEGIEHTKEILRCMVLVQRAPTMRELAIIAGLPAEDRDNLWTLKNYIIRCGAFLTLGGYDYDEDNRTVEWIDPSAEDHLETYAKDELGLDLKPMQYVSPARRFKHIFFETIRSILLNSGDKENYDC
ncbi:hypothetical protein EJ04DRAFT_306080 [Polyplosphaeria fusca]|uniref:Ig-like domain-containing protein n=1 Tax=Polyplosphaeria fusca TaxID=682080 RepID=A0A9P4V109_9PLEO|nr:hypothetical protein EJ04DRAFT_306080 [Polyplosphaeria fusca]